MTNAFFIVSPGTGNGKTIITAALVNQLHSMGKSVFPIKPIISGWDELHVSEMDTALLLRAIDQDVTDSLCAQVSPWRYASPVSPDIAASREGEVIVLEEVVSYVKEVCCSNKYDYVVIEGAGGIMTPINESSTMLDLAELMPVSVCIVTGIYLGAISHTLSSIEVLKSRGVNIRGLVVNEERTVEDTKVEEMIGSIRSYIGNSLPILHVPHLGQEADMWRSVPDLTSLVLLS